MGVPPTENVYDLVVLLEGLISRRRSSGPLVYLLNSQDRTDVAGRSVSGFRDRLLDINGDSLVSHAYLSVDKASPDRSTVEVLDEIAGQFSASMPGSSGKMDLHSYWLLRAAMQGRVSGGSPGRQRREMRNHLFDEVAARRGSLDWLTGVSDKGPSKFVQGLVFSILMRLPRFLYGVWLRRTRKFRWVSEGMIEPLAKPRTNLLKSCVFLAENGKAIDNPTLIHATLIEAILQDLAAARGSALSVNRKRRQWRPVFLFSEIGDERSAYDEICQSLLEKVNEHPDLFILIAAANRNPSWAEAELTYVDRFKVLPSGQATAVSVKLGAYPDDSTQRLLDTNPKISVYRPSLKDWFPVAFLSMLAAVALVVSGLFFVQKINDARDDCRLVKEMNGESVGITDGSCLAIVGEKETQNILELIATENKKARQQANESGVPLRTIAYLTPLDKPAIANRSSLSLQQLKGAFASQQYYNTEVDIEKMRTQLLLVDPGGEYQHADAVIKDLVNLVDSDDVIVEGFVGVAGVSQSWNRSLEAIETLEKNDIVVVGAGVTGSELSDPIAAPGNYVQVSPNNTDIANRIVEEIKEDERVVVVYDPRPDDLFSNDLRNQLKKALESRPKSDSLFEDVPYPAAEETDGLPANGAAKQICDQIATGKGKTVVLYAGRGTDFSDLLNAAVQRPECNNESVDEVRLYSSTDLPKLFVGANTIDPNSFPPFNIYSTQYGDTEARMGTGLGRALCRYHVNNDWGVQTTDAAQGFDAVALILKAVSDVGGDEDGIDDLYRAVRYQIEFEGVQLAGSSTNIVVNQDNRRPDPDQTGILVDQEIKSEPETECPN